jgi:peptidoglycan-associated lipoprotein
MLAVSLVFVAVSIGCASKTSIKTSPEQTPVVGEPPSPQPGGGEAPPSSSSPLPQEKGGGEGGEGGGGSATSEGSSTASQQGLEDVHFDYDQYNILSKAGSILEGNAQWLKKNSQAKVEIEGHCDERGTVEYNLALGEKRARSAKDYLISLGIEPNRISTVSYGEEKPLDPGQNEEAWGKNRRAHFRILSE